MTNGLRPAKKRPKDWRMFYKCKTINKVQKSNISSLKRNRLQCEWIETKNGEKNSTRQLLIGLRKTFSTSSTDSGSTNSGHANMTNVTHFAKTKNGYCGEHSFFALQRVIVIFQARKVSTRVGCGVANVNDLHSTVNWL